MNILIAPDSFKESLSARAAADAIAEGWRAARPEDSLVLVPIADGGEGTVDALVAAAGGVVEHATVTGPLGHKVRAAYGVLDDGETVVVEMAAASGLALVPPTERNPETATTRGTGELLLHAACIPEAKRVLLGIGGSATNDGGAGFVQALGYRLLDSAGEVLPPGGAALARLAKIEAPEQIELLPQITVVCDVTNPLCGPHGASQVYGPQKGATQAQVDSLDADLRHYATIVEEFTGRACQLVPGAGAAGGLGFALLSFTDAVLRPGFEVVAEFTGLEAKIAAADLVITGEGRADVQSLMGKAVGGVLALAKRHGKRALVFAGSLGDGHAALHEAGAERVEAIGPADAELDDRIENAAVYLREAATRLAAGLA